MVRLSSDSIQKQSAFHARAIVRVLTYVRTYVLCIRKIHTPFYTIWPEQGDSLSTMGDVEDDDRFSGILSIPDHLSTTYFPLTTVSTDHQVELPISGEHESNSIG